MGSKEHSKSTISQSKRVRHGDIVASLRAKILDGTFSAGQRLPTHAELEKQFSTSVMTVSKALDVLQQHGFIRTEKRRGMYVAEKLPHRSHYALVFEWKQEGFSSQFYRALRNEAALFEESGRHFSIFYGIDAHTDTEDYQRLLGFVRAHRLAGLIFAQEPHEIEGSPLLVEPGIPRVVIGTQARHPGIPAVYPDLDAFLPKALDDLAARGRRRIALIKKTDNEPRPDPQSDQFLRETAARGLTTRPCWIQSVDPHAPHWGNETAQLLMFAPPAERPDGLIIRDDNLVEHVTEGLAATGVQVPHKLEVIAHTNFPSPTPSAVPVRRLGYDVRQLFQICVERIDALRRGEQPVRVTLLPALFEEELAVSQSAAQPVGVR